jgi:hypothetical protein
VTRAAIGLTALVIGVAPLSVRAQTAAELSTTMAVQQDAAAGEARAGTGAIVGAVFGGKPGSAPSGSAAAPPAAPAPADPSVPDDGTRLDLRPSSAPAPAGDVPPAAVAAALAQRGRDPFRPFTLDLRPETREAEVLSPLQRYEIPQLRLAATVLDLKPPRAMLQDNSGMGFIITPGTPIGRRHGVVKAIEAKRVIVEEHVLDYYGREQTHQIAIEMAKDDKPQSVGQETP